MPQSSGPNPDDLVGITDEFGGIDPTRAAALGYDVLDGSLFDFVDVLQTDCAMDANELRELQNRGDSFGRPFRGQSFRRMDARSRPLGASDAEHAST